jgi:mono/diheme cytochrome c family protein
MASNLWLIPIFLVTLVPVLAQDRTGNAASGLRFAETWCSGCHAIDLKLARTGGIAPDFRTIANRPSTTNASLTAFFATQHNVMPNFELTSDETSDVVAYILSLKEN